MQRFLSRKVLPLTPQLVRTARVFFVAVPSVILLVSLFFVVMGTREWMLARASLAWPTVSGAVDSSKVVSSRHKSKSGHHTSHHAHVEYHYTVDEREYTNSKVAFRVSSEGQSDAETVAARYPLGSAVIVHYDPVDPENAVLVAGADWSNAIPIGVGLFCGAFSIVFIRVALRITKRMLDACSSSAAT